MHKYTLSSDALGNESSAQSQSKSVTGPASSFRGPVAVRLHQGPGRPLPGTRERERDGFADSALSLRPRFNMWFKICAWSHALRCSVVSRSATLWTVSHQAPLSVEFSRQEYWSRLPFPSPEDLRDPGIERASPGSVASQAGLYQRAPAKPYSKYLLLLITCKTGGRYYRGQLKTQSHRIL